MEEQIKTSKFWNAIDNIDRHLYGRKMKNFLIGSILVLAVAPFLDYFLEVPYDRLTFYSTLFFFIYTLILVLAWLSVWRDENGKWTLSYALTCGKDRIVTYYKISKNTASATRTTSTNEILYKVGTYSVLIAIGWKSLQNLSVFIRKPIEALTHTRRGGFRDFETMTKHWTTAIFFIGLAILIYLYYSNPKILQRIKLDLIRLFGRKNSDEEYDNVIITSSENSLVISSANEQEMSLLMSSKSGLFYEFTEAIKNWKPKNCITEKQYQNSLLLYLSTTSLASSDIESEKPIGGNLRGTKGRADIVINNHILIEMKRDSSAGAIQRAQGQISNYSNMWRNRGPVVLLLCNHDFEHAKLAYTPTMIDLNKLERPVLTIVAQ